VSLDLETWSTEGVFVSEPDECGFREATVSEPSSSVFFRMEVSK